LFLGITKTSFRYRDVVLIHPSILPLLVTRDFSVDSALAELDNLVEVKGIITLPAIERPIESRIGNRVIEWDRETLNRVISQLQSERRTIDADFPGSLLNQAEQIKRETEQHITQRAAPG